MSDSITVTFQGREYVWNGKLWFAADDYTTPPTGVQAQLMRLLPVGASKPPEDRGGIAVIECRILGKWRVIAHAEVSPGGRVLESSCPNIDNVIIEAIEECIREDEYDVRYKHWDGTVYQWLYRPYSTDKPTSSRQAPLVSALPKDPNELLLLLPAPTPRQGILLACAIIREAWHLLTDNRSRAFIECAERFADGQVSLADFEFAGDRARQVSSSSEHMASDHVVFAVECLTNSVPNRLLLNTVLCAVQDSLAADVDSDKRRWDDIEARLSAMLIDVLNVPHKSCQG